VRLVIPHRRRPTLFKYTAALFAMPYIGDAAMRARSASQVGHSSSFTPANGLDRAEAPTT